MHLPTVAIRAAFGAQPPSIRLVTSLLSVPKRLLLGRARPSSQVDATLLPKRLALPVFASDPVSSVAFAAQELLVVLALGGVALLTLAPGVALAACLLLVVVVVSYGQVVRAYPGGGGSYAAVTENLGAKTGAVTAAALVVDYVLTVAVSTAAAAENLAALAPGVVRYQSLVAIGGVVLVMLVNLRGRREAGWVSTLPAYGFVVAVAVLIAVGLARAATGDTPRAASADYGIATGEATGALLVLLVLRAFASGGTALAGVEAVANGVPAFRKPQARNAALTLLAVGGLSVALLAGVVTLAVISDVRITADTCDLVGYPGDCAVGGQDALLPQLAGAVFGAGSIAVPIIAIAAVLVLLSAANSAYNGFPLLAAVLAQDRYLPRQLANRGDRLAYGNGIVTLSVAAVATLVVFSADVGRLIQLYLLGLLLSFTLAQVGMVRRSRAEAALTRGRSRWPGTARLALAITSAIATGSVLVISTVVKVPGGGWVVVLLGVLVYAGMRFVRRHYDQVSDQLAIREIATETMPARVHAVVLVSRLHRPVLRALAYARATRPSTLEAITVAVEPDAARAVLAEWRRLKIPVPLKVLDSPYREITGPLMEYVAALRRSHPRDAVTVFVPEYVVGRWWERLLHNQSTLWLKSRLQASPGVMVVSVPWLLSSADDDVTDTVHS